LLMEIGYRSASTSGHVFRSSSKGNWKNVTDRYLGLKFGISGEVHYGWARVSVVVKGATSFTAVLLGYAFETNPKQAIRAGATGGAREVDAADNPGGPATLGALALGSAGR
jgi:hypothetical protein